MILPPAPYGFIDLRAVTPLFVRKLHRRIMGLGWDCQVAIDRFHCPFPPEVKSVFHLITLYFSTGSRRGSCAFFWAQTSVGHDLRWPFAFKKSGPRTAGAKCGVNVALVGNTQNNETILTDLPTVVHRLNAS